MAFEKEQAQEKKHEPHADRDTNVAQFQRMIDKVYWIPEYLFEQEAPAGKMWINYSVSESKTDSVFDPSIDKHVTTTNVTDYKCVAFCWGISGEMKKTCVISFNQENKDRDKKRGFSYELSNALNYLGEKGFLVHREREANGVPLKTKLHFRMRASREPLESRSEMIVYDLEGKVCPVNIWQDIPDRSSQTSRREPDRWEQLNAHLS